MEFRALVCRVDSGSGTLLVSGSVDETRVDDLRSAIDECTGHYTRDLTIDLADVDFLPSTAVGVLAEALREAGKQGRRLELLAPAASIAGRVLLICGLPHVHR
ncbi:STAS domain-containing protein [Nocardioides bigeumensis]|uniref:STAS domain-containing protein n=1 Tax=Nocardioides bigeumensis TaxID=433657 RepID=A0ABN2XQQ4_9ACTN